MRGDTLIDATLYEEPPVAPDMSQSYVPAGTTMRIACEKHACMASGDMMASQLDRALDAPAPHPDGATIACR